MVIDNLIGCTEWTNVNSVRFLRHRPIPPLPDLLEHGMWVLVLLQEGAEARIQTDWVRVRQEFANPLLLHHLPRVVIDTRIGYENIAELLIAAPSSSLRSQP